MPHKDPLQRKAYKAAYQLEHCEEIRERKAIYNAAHCVEIQVYNAAYRAAHPEESRARRSAYYLSHPEEESAYAAARYTLHADEVKAKAAAWALAHPEQKKAVAAASYAANPAEAKARAAAWRIEHPEERKAMKGKRRAQQANAPINDFTAAQWRGMKTAYGFCCAYCDRKGVRLTQDHIIPLSKGGNHTLSNIVPACQSCNSKKYTGPPLRPIQPLLLVAS